MNAPEPADKSGVADFIKGIGKAAIAAAAATPEKFAWRNGERRGPKVRPVPVPVKYDSTPGVRALRRHKRAGNPASFTACVCKGCVGCGRLSMFRMPCHPCSRGRHARSGYGAANRRKAEQLRIAFVNVRMDDERRSHLAPNHRAMVKADEPRRGRRK